MRPQLETCSSLTLPSCEQEKMGTSSRRRGRVARSISGILTRWKAWRALWQRRDGASGWRRKSYKPRGSPAPITGRA